MVDGFDLYILLLLVGAPLCTSLFDLESSDPELVPPELLELEPDCSECSDLDELDEVELWPEFYRKSKDSSKLSATCSITRMKLAFYTADSNS